MRVHRVASPGDPRDGTDLMRIHVHREGFACLASANCNSPIRRETEEAVFLNAGNDVGSRCLRSLRLGMAHMLLDGGALSHHQGSAAAQSSMIAEGVPSTPPWV